jgi:hypothetical protein
MTEADTCRKFVAPRLQAAGWDNDPHSIAEQRYFTAGRIISQGHTAWRRPGKRADYLLRYTRDLPLGVVEAKGLHEVGEASPGSADRNRTLGAKGLMRIPVPVPPFAQQVRFDTLCREVDGLKRLQTETATELDALLPAILDRAFKGDL